LFGFILAGSIGKTRRILILASKIIQNIANDLVSAGKEAYMALMNNFVLEYKPKLLAFLSSIIVRENEILL
jgi:hypothetical protein